MVVISGKYRARKLISLDSTNTRPTSARMKEDMFNILNNYFIYEGKKSLDLFAGSGALSLEGLSRGVNFAVLNDHYQPAINIINENFRGVESWEYAVYQKDYLQLLELLILKKDQFDLIYLDPPFSEIEYYFNVFEKILANNLLKNWGIVVVECAGKFDLSIANGLTLLKSKAYKNKNLYFFRLERE
ncbi:16S rRNA (guanine(966)-N(2))-methyltransferase RsmD [Mesoplasma syrphidae]|uniref:16S rRNA (Guanine(966)-N(2))-methyltransferase RsmD n=1 Tax=Mesoplasma syrphidae TaxID=225999 RepID=A0A2K9BJB8_9MOLU|nr:16S rRNA (guanine(966)-N(2))-methyltransferase RsmD [Mesoplasma syrphidae]AUF83386.1 16S rRNA (guanine(966)-N(2))-methyltransferase RsmD [Mesoplasma syrphidae]